METKKLTLQFEKGKVAVFEIDLLNLENYKSKFLALKNHERNTEEILEVLGFNGSNSVRVVMLIGDEEGAEYEMERCHEYIEQFGTITHEGIEDAWLCNKDENSIDYKLNHEDWYIF